MQVISDAVETMIESLVEFAPNSPHEWDRLTKELELKSSNSLGWPCNMET